MPRRRPYRGRVFLHPGRVTSRADGDRHYVTAYALASLYRINVLDCTVVDADRMPTAWIVQSLRDHGEILPVDWAPEPGDVHLYPRRDGKYPLFYKGVPGRKY